MNKLLRIIFPLAFIFLCTAFLFFFCSPTSTKSESQLFIVPEQTEEFDVVKNIQAQQLIRSEWFFRILMNGKIIQSGGYRLTRTMWVWDVISKLTGKPDLLWITVVGCQRKEQIAELIGKKLGWDEIQRNEFTNAYKNLQEEYIEGVYYPDTYLIPIDETGSQVAQRFIDRFNEKFAPYFEAFQDQNIRWVTGLKIASLIEREAGGPEDMKIISGIIWNRLDDGMRLQIDATMQYTHGKNSDGSWWGSIDLAEKKNDSPYNTYVYKGLPPTPICSPSITSIEAVLYPEATECLFYLHDNQKQIHCAQTYEEHKENIETYLKN